MGIRLCEYIFLTIDKIYENFTLNNSDIMLICLKFGVIFVENKKRLRDNRILLNLYQIYKFIVIFPCVGVSTIALALPAALLLFVFGPKTAQICGKIWSRFNGFMTPMLVSVVGMENVDRKQSYVIVANHLSLYDIFAVYGWFPVDIRWVMKIELRKIPIMGYMAEKMGHICIDRSNSRAAINTINAAKNRITGGTSAFFFPEGTRSETETMLPFKKGAFRLAVDMGLPILPLTIVGTNYVLPTNTISLFPGRVKIIAHKPIDIKGYNYETLEKLMNDARIAIESGFTGEFS